MPSATYTRDDVDRLKLQWRADPCWDIEHTDGFEKWEKELREYRLAWEAVWKAEYAEKVSTRAAKLECSKALAEHIMHLENRISQLEGGDNA